MGWWVRSAGCDEEVRLYTDRDGEFGLVNV